MIAIKCLQAGIFKLWDIFNSWWLNKNCGIFMNPYPMQKCWRQRVKVPFAFYFL